MLYDPLSNPLEVGHNTAMTSSDEYEEYVSNSQYSTEELDSPPVTPDGWQGLLPLRAGSEGRGEQMPGTDWHADRRGVKQELGSTPVTQCDDGIRQTDELYDTQTFRYVPVPPSDRNIDHMTPSYQVAKEAARYTWEWVSYCDDKSILSPTNPHLFVDGIVGNLHTQWSRPRTIDSGISVGFNVSSYPTFEIGSPCFAHISVTLRGFEGRELMTISNRNEPPKRVLGEYNGHGPHVVFKTKSRILQEALAVSDVNPVLWALRFSATVWLYRSSDITGWGPQPLNGFHVHLL
jgi:hypothetical protein